MKGTQFENNLNLFHVSFSYPEMQKLTLNDISVSFKEGMMYVILGPNGCGKSTLLKTACGILRFRDGMIYLNGNEFPEYSRKELSKIIGIMEPEAPVPHGMTLRELLHICSDKTISPFWKGSDDVNKRMSEVCRLTETEQWLDLPLDRISSGQRQLCWLAALIIQDTQYLLLDEPASFLDLKNQSKIIEILKRLKTEYKKTVILVMHDIVLAQQCADEIILMNEGQIVQQCETLAKEQVEKIYGIQVNEIKLNNKKILLPFL